MCGLTGWQINSSISKELKPQAGAFTLSQSHRGPDATDFFLKDDASVYLGHNRLSIIDLSNAANQPMYSNAGDVMILNGEIYNYKELRLELIKKGHSFTTSSDSEVVLKAYVEWGVEFTKKMHGMYAIAIWDKNSNTIHLFRDPLGIKPIYYWVMPNQQGVVFASELKSFMQIDSFTPTVSDLALSHFVEFGHSISPEKTIFENVFKLQPGHRLELSNHKASKQIRFYSPPLKLESIGKNVDLEEHLYTTLSDVIKEHMVADVPIGLLLSGGLDSSLIASIASQHSLVHTFSMGFADSNVDERPFAKKVSNSIGSIHKEILIDPEEIIEQLEHLPAHFDDLFADWGMVTTKLLYSKCKEQGIKVVLVGEGSDELFGGYSVFKQSLKNSPIEIALFRLYRQYIGRRYGSNYGEFRALMKSYLGQCNNDLFSAIRLFETRTQLPNNFVMKVDKASMATSIEARTPFLDSRITDIAYQLSKDQLISSNDEKLILKSIARRYKLLPEEIIERRKFGSGIASNWLEESPSFRTYAREHILAPNSWVDRLNLRDAMQRYFDHGETGYAFPRSISIFSNLAWRLLILSLWSKSLGLNS